MANERGVVEGPSLDFYITFDHLTTKDFGSLLVSCAELFDTAYRYYSAEAEGPVPFAAWAEPPALDVAEIRTGESIKFKFIERAIPTISSDKDHDIVIGVPKKLGIPALMAFLLLSAADKAMDMRNKYYDGEIKKIELQLKQQEIDKIRHRHEGKVPEVLDKQSQQIVESLVGNPSFRSVSVNGVPIKISGREAA